MRFAQTSWQLRRAEIRLLYRRGCGRASRLSLGSCPAAAQSATIGARSLTIRPAPHPLKHFGFQHGFAEKFEQQEQIGAGSFGQVFVAVDRLTGDRFAVKRLRKKYASDDVLDPVYVERVLHECDILAHLGASLNIAFLYGVYEGSASVDLVLELCTGGDLAQKIATQRFTEKDVQKIVRDVFRTCAQAHARHVVIRDVKPENFLFVSSQPDSPLKAIDFGMATYCSGAPDDWLCDRAGTAVYVAPEVLKQHYSLPADVWSAGIVTYQLLTGRLPFAGEEGSEVSTSFKEGRGCRNKDIWRAVLYSELDFDVLSSQARDFVVSLLQRDPSLRPTAAQALRHRWLAEAALPDVPLSSTIVQRLQRFGTYGRLKQVALRTIAQRIGADHELVMGPRELFQSLDVDADGVVSVGEMEAALQDGRFDLSVDEADQLLRSLMAPLSSVLDGGGQILYHDWLAAVLDWREVFVLPEWPGWLRRAFEGFDTNGSGLLETHEVEALLCGEVCLFPDTVDSALREADADHDGAIGLDEFEELLLDEGELLEFFPSRLL